MRYALRKQDKIKEVLGKKYLENNILQSLNKYFENSDNDRIYSDIEPDGYVTDYSNKYPLLRINDVANSDAYIDITFEFALHENPSIYEYVTFGEYDAKTIRKAVLETGYYGEIYKWLYYQSKK